MREAIWTTKDGQRIPVLWMASGHLVNSFNMLLKKNNIAPAQVDRIAQSPKNEIFRVMRDDIRARGLYNWAPGDVLHKFDGTRETPPQLCMLRAIIDTKPKNWEEIVDRLYQDRDRYIEHVLSCADPKWTPVVTKFVEYRLDHGGS